jgi:hypothetical protein
MPKKFVAINTYYLFAKLKIYQQHFIFRKSMLFLSHGYFQPSQKSITSVYCYLRRLPLVMNPSLKALNRGKVL